MQGKYDVAIGGGINLAESRRFKGVRACRYLVKADGVVYEQRRQMKSLFKKNVRLI
jgi:hypothetical protein